jgi:hypothetical protein
MSVSPWKVAVLWRDALGVAEPARPRRSWRVSRFRQITTATSVETSRERGWSAA